MTARLEEAFDKARALPASEQDALAAQILESIATENSWTELFAAYRDRLRQLAREALEEDARGETRPLEDLL